MANEIAGRDALGGRGGHGDGSRFLAGDAGAAGRGGDGERVAAERAEAAEQRRQGRLDLSLIPFWMCIREST